MVEQMNLLGELGSALYGKDLLGVSMEPKAEGVVLERFGFPPFTVLDARKGEWQERKRRWISLGIKSEVGRDAPVLTISTKAGEGGTPQEDYTSVFDPVLTECMYRWFCPPRGQIVDPFAGGSVRGIVAGMLNRDYWGCDLREEQVRANYQQAAAIRPRRAPFWMAGDSFLTVHDAPRADFVFSCPPYGDLEVYSEEEGDLSNMDADGFESFYERIIWHSVKRLKQDRFACFVVGDYRGRNGIYTNFVSKTIDYFQRAGAALYNEAILVTAVGSGSMRANRVFGSNRKMIKTHQNVLVFVKGDWQKAAAACKEGEN